MNLSLCSYNVRGLGNKLKREQIFAWLKSSNHTFCMLQETHSGENTHNSWKYEWGNDAFWSGINNNSPGIVRPVKRDWAVLSKDTPVDISILKSVNQSVFIHL